MYKGNMYTYMYGEGNMYEDANGRLLTSDELDELSPWEIEERQIHLINEI